MRFLFGVILVLMFFGMMGVVSAVPSWNESSHNVTYNATEDIVYYHNLTLNLTNYDPTMTFVIDTDKLVIWNGGNYSYSVVSDWIYINDSSDGLLILNSTQNNQTGNFSIHIQAYGGGSSGVWFNFTISPVNDAPNFINLDSYHSWLENSENVTVYFNASDEEGEIDGTGYPLNFSVNVTGCNYSVASSRVDNIGCNDLFSWEDYGDSSVQLNITRVNDFVGTYNVTFWVNDSNSQTEFNTTFEINNTNNAPNITFSCDDNRSINEDDYLQCWVNATDIDEENNITFKINSDLIYFVFNDSSKSYSYDCSGGQCNASANISFLTNDSYVGNWSVNISATDTGSPVGTAWSNFSFFVNNSEDNVSLESDSESITIFENGTLNISAYDDDFLINSSQYLIKQEMVTFNSNNSNLIYFKTAGGARVDSLTRSVTNYPSNYSNIVAYIDWDYANSSGIQNAMVKINVSDRLGNSGSESYSSDELVINLNFSSTSAPVWDVNTPTNYIIAEDNSTWGGINLSLWASDSDEETLIYHFINLTEFCSLNSINFNSTSGIVNFTPSDCDVGYHNITIYADDGNVNASKEFNFTITNVNDDPAINSLTYENSLGGGNVGVGVVNAEDSQVNFTLVMEDNDFLIPLGQEDYYDENLTIVVSVTNISNSSQLFYFFSNFLWDSSYSPDNNQTRYLSSFTPSGVDVGNYSVLINITDSSNVSVDQIFYLNITEVGDVPVLDSFENQTATINEGLYYDFNASDEEDGNESAGVIKYTISNLSVGGNFINSSNFNSSDGIINLTSLSDYEGFWEYNISVNDSNGLVDWEIFSLTIYGLPNITFPLNNNVFNWIENIPISDGNFTIDYGVNNTNLTYEFYMDRIVFSNATTYNYTNLTTSSYLRNSTNQTYLTEDTNFTLVFAPDYLDESYGMLKNLTLIVYNPTYPELNDSVNWAVNITHTNNNVSFSGNISESFLTGRSYRTGFSLDLGDYFSDVDFDDEYYQNDSVNFTFYSGSTFSNIKVNGNPIPDNSVGVSLTLTDWNVIFTGEGAVDPETIWIVGEDFNETNVSMSNATSNNFSVSFVEPDTIVQTETSSGGGGSNKLKHYSLKIVNPQDVIISGNNYIEIPFSIENVGQIDLEGISINSYIQFKNEFTEDISINLEEGYIESLKYGQSENFTMRINANTQRSGKYKATIYANVTSPKFSDWGDFFIDLRKTNETEAEQLLMFTDKFIAENPECLELSEIVVEAQKAFDIGEYSNSLRLAQEATEACEEAIEKNKQIRFGGGKVAGGFYHISLITLGIFFLGFVFYIYKRVRFNKSRVDEYI